MPYISVQVFMMGITQVIMWFFKPFNVKTIRLEFEIHILTAFVKPSAKDVSCMYVFNVGGS